MTDKIVVFSTCGSREEAVRIASRLIERRLAACVSILSAVESVYRWQGKVEESSEVLLLVKSSRDLFAQLRTELEHIHSYEVHEIIALPVLAGSDAYLTWMERELEQSP